MVKRRNVNGKSKGKGGSKQGASNMGNSILKWLSPEEPPKEKRKKTMDTDAVNRKTRSEVKAKEIASGSKNISEKNYRLGSNMDASASEFKDYDEAANAIQEPGTSKSSDKARSSRVKVKRAISPGSDNIKVAEDKSKPIDEKKELPKMKASVHDMSPSPESPATRSGYETGDTEKYDGWSDEDSQETTYWKNDGATANHFLRSKIDPTKDLKRQLKLVSRWSQQDTKAYREGYPGKEDSEKQRDNYLFYTNEIPSRPDGGKIEEILETWKGDYAKLERHHGYIQWLFPIRERGMNWVSQELQTHEIEDIKKDKDALDRFFRSYELMLDFYGLKVKNRETGELERAENWEERLKHLNRSFHNYLRITRVLKSLGELGFEHMKKPCVEFLLDEAIDRQTIPNAAKSCVEYWIHTLRDTEERNELIRKVKAFIESD